MKLLSESGLYGQGLVEITSPRVTEHYNMCLERIGQEPTKLKTFSIDGRGWSPEIADEKEDLYYLSNGDANPYAIIVTPSQEDLPVYYPHHSFDRDLLRYLFKTAGRQIADLTSLTAILIELDQSFDLFTTPDDLTMIDSVVIKVFTMGDFMDAARKQRQLVHSLKEGNNWMNVDLREELFKSGLEHGDLRYRSMVIENIPYMDINSFYSVVFGGVYIFRDHIMDSKPLMIFEEEYQDYEKRDNVFFIAKGTDQIIDRLVDEGLVGFSLDFCKSNPEFLYGLRQQILSELILEHEKHNSHFDVTILDDCDACKKYIPKLQEKLPSVYQELLILAKKLEREEVVSVGDISKELERLLLRPCVNQDEEPVFYDLVMRLLVSLINVPVDELYAYHKDLFFSKYKHWTTAKKRWSINQIKKTTDKTV